MTLMTATRRMAWYGLKTRVCEKGAHNATHDNSSLYTVHPVCAKAQGFSCRGDAAAWLSRHVSGGRTALRSELQTQYSRARPGVLTEWNLIPEIIGRNLSVRYLASGTGCTFSTLPEVSTLHRPPKPWWNYT